MLVWPSLVLSVFALPHKCITLAFLHSSFFSQNKDGYILIGIHRTYHGNQQQYVTALQGPVAIQRWRGTLHHSRTTDRSRDQADRTALSPQGGHDDLSSRCHHSLSPHARQGHYQMSLDGYESVRRNKTSSLFCQYRKRPNDGLVSARDVPVDVGTVVRRQAARQFATVGNGHGTFRCEFYAKGTQARSMA